MKEYGVSIKGGLARGFGALGVVDWFQKEIQIPPRVVAGSSSGAIVAAGVGADLRLEEGMKILRELKFFRDLVDTSKIWSNRSLVDSDLYRRKLETLFGAGTQIEELPTKLIVFATDPISKQRVYIEKGSLVDALMASSSYRPIFPAVKVNGNSLVDGDHTENYSSGKLRESGAEVVIGVGFKNRKGEKRRSFGEPVDIEILYEVGNQGYIDFGEKLGLTVENAFNAALLVREDVLSLIVDK